MAARFGEQLYDGRANPYPAGGGHCDGARQLHLRAPAIVMKNEDQQAGLNPGFIERSL
jgi:hypothetical protein